MTFRDLELAKFVKNLPKEGDAGTPYYNTTTHNVVYWTNHYVARSNPIGSSLMSLANETGMSYEEIHEYVEGLEDFPMKEIVLSFLEHTIKKLMLP